MDRTFERLNVRYGASTATTYEWLRTKYQIPAIEALYQAKHQFNRVGRNPGFLVSMEIVSQYRNPERFPTTRSNSSG